MSEKEEDTALDKDLDKNDMAAESDVEEQDVVAEDTEVSLEQELEEARAKADESWDKYVRLQAEMENLRRRSKKQVEDAHKYASQKFVENLLPVIDSVEIGMQAEGDLDKIREGMALVLKQFESVMDKFNIEVINPVGE